MNFFRVKSILTLSLLIMLISCTKENEQQNVPIPYVPINLRFSINDPAYSNLQNVGAWIYVDNEGSRGLIIYRESTETIRTYERHCTFDPTEVCSTVDMDPGLLRANDYDCCGSEFGIATRVILKGPATRFLLEYDTSFDGTFVEVTN